MRIHSLLLLLVITIAAPVAGNGQGKKVKLFNGKNLDHWYTFIAGKGKNTDPNKVFTLEDRLIRISGEEYGCLTTKDEYENYVLKAKFRR